MVQVIVQHRVKSFDDWLPAFKDHAETRTKFGCEGATVHRTVTDPNDVVILLRWNSAANFDRFLRDSDLKEAMKGAGVLEEPRITIATDAVA